MFALLSSRRYAAVMIILNARARLITSVLFKSVLAYMYVSQIVHSHKLRLTLLNAYF